MNRHHPYGGYDERPARGGRGGGPSMRGRPPRPGGMSPPPSEYPSAQAAYGTDAGSAPYQPQGAYTGNSEFSGGPDRHYATPMSGGPPPRGGMGSRGGNGPRPPPTGNGPNMSPPQTYGYTPASFENNSYNASGPYDQAPYAPNAASGSAPPPGQPPYGQAAGYSQDYSSGGPPPSGPPGPGFDGQNFGRPPPFGGSYPPGPPPGQFGRPPRPPGGGPGFRGGRGGGRGGRGGGFGGGGGARGDDEKPCRTLFVRSIQFETDSQFVKAEFEKFGEIQTFFDMVNKRGIAFITYYDLRSARDAMLAMKGQRFGGRPINIHYSLPREEDKAQRCDRDKNQGTLFTVLKGANDILTDDAVHQIFSEFGDVKKVRDYPGQKNSRFVEYFDSRACQLAHDRLNGQTHLDGQWDLKFAWDVVTDDDLEWAQVPGPGIQLGPGAQPAWGRPGPPPQQQQQPRSDRAPLPTILASTHPDVLQALASVALPYRPQVLPRTMAGVAVLDLALVLRRRCLPPLLLLPLQVQRTLTASSRLRRCKPSLHRSVLLASLLRRWHPLPLPPQHRPRLRRPAAHLPPQRPLLHQVCQPTLLLCCSPLPVRPRLTSRPSPRREQRRDRTATASNQCTSCSACSIRTAHRVPRNSRVFCTFTQPFVFNHSIIQWNASIEEDQFQNSR